MTYCSQDIFNSASLSGNRKIGHTGKVCFKNGNKNSSMTLLVEGTFGSNIFLFGAMSSAPECPRFSSEFQAFSANKVSSFINNKLSTLIEGSFALQRSLLNDFLMYQIYISDMKKHEVLNRIGIIIALDSTYKGTKFKSVLVLKNSWLFIYQRDGTLRLRVLY